MARSDLVVTKVRLLKPTRLKLEEAARAQSTTLACQMNRRLARSFDHDVIEDIDVSLRSIAKRLKALAHAQP
jgi:hypothetical protein